MGVAALNLGGNVIGINYDKMRLASHRIRCAAEETECMGRSLSKAIDRLQTASGYPRLKLYASQLGEIYDKTNHKLYDMHRVNDNINYAIQRFEEVDIECAYRISAMGVSNIKLLNPQLNIDHLLAGDISGTSRSLVRQSLILWTTLAAVSTGTHPFMCESKSKQNDSGYDKTLFGVGYLDRAGILAQAIKGAVLLDSNKVGREKGVLKHVNKGTQNCLLNEKNGIWIKNHLIL